MISLVVGPYFDMPPLLLPGLEPATPGTLTVLTRVRCLSLKPDMDREVRSHPDSRISAEVQSWEIGLSRVLRPDDHRNHPELRHVSSLHYRLRHQSCHYWVVASILGFLVHKKYTLTLMWDENFFSLIRSNGVSKNPSFHTDFKNVHMTLVKSAPKKSFSQKTILPIENLPNY